MSDSLNLMEENKIITMGDPSQFPTPEEMKEIMESEFEKKDVTNLCAHCPRKKVCFHLLMISQVCLCKYISFFK
jgi:hypothetical protein